MLTRTRRTESGGGHTQERSYPNAPSKDYSYHFRRLLESELPEDARVLTTNGADIVLLATWRLKTDPQRAGKRSKMIRLVISEEALDDYAAGADGTRLTSDQRFTAWINAQLAAFNTDHDSPLGVEAPSITWNLNTIELNG